ncbi:disintegrin and metalloproteinase domain-containing protein 11 isoform X2 [Spea bombifrons]|uniref:disintegrin and metalloproteinase domain-containing protein 11 isoform X2 n=1 Tax=Spea bombifrons TaxID=233779 RepID=UPI0023499859|nr:disintegrin and metalloproteinase domain-containing protein 11 isoform X2 [Spea bombifrons]
MRFELLWVVAAVISAMPELGFPLVNSTLPRNTAKQEAPNSWHQPLDPPQIIYPSRLVGQTSGTETRRYQLDTQAAHLASTSFLVPVFGKKIVLDLELNHNLLSSRYAEVHYSDQNNTRVMNPVGAADHCYYQGHVRGVEGSWAAISTCHGLRGTFSDGLYTYTLSPMEHNKEESDRWPHVIQRISRCSHPGCDHHEGIPPSPKTRRKRQVRRTVHSALTETKYIELLVVNDRQMYDQQRQSLSLTSGFVKTVVNVADAIFRDQLNTKLVLVGMETWTTADKISVTDEPLQVLADFMRYRRTEISEHSDATHLFSGRTFKSSRSGAAYFGGICSPTLGGGVNEYGSMNSMAVTLAQTLGQNLGMMWNKPRTSAGDCKCPDLWLGCIMEDTGYYLPQKFSRCSIDEYSQFLQDGGGSCLFNKPLKLFDAPSCGNGFVEVGEECDCGSPAECMKSGAGNCCKKCTLSHDAMCSDGLCCRGCKYEPRGTICREPVNECDVPETCLGDSSVCPPNLHKQDGYFCDNEQGRCYGGRCKTRDRQCSALWGRSASDRFCYEKLNIEGTEKGNCGKDGETWIQCNKQDVLCGYLLCSNISGTPRIGELNGDITSMSFYHQNRYLDCRGGQVVLPDGSYLGYVDDGTPCGPNMMCLDRRCLPAAVFNFSSCPSSLTGGVCSDHGVCSNEGKCICHPDWTGKDCSVYDPLPVPKPTGVGERYKGPSGTNIIIGSIAGAVLIAAIVLGGTGWGFKNIRRGRSGGG